MSKEALVERIISDAQEAAVAQIDAANRRAEEIISEAARRAERNKAGAEAEASARAKAIIDGKAAAARLDAAKITLAEKRRVLDEIYERAKQKLFSLDKTTAVKLSDRLLKEYAEEGDTVVFNTGFPYIKEVSALPVIKEKKLAIQPKTADIGGGFVLYGKKSDKDLSYAALIAADREEYQASLAAKVFAASNKAE